jgi:hypothetical protein
MRLKARLVAANKAAALFTSCNAVAAAVPAALQFGSTCLTNQMDARL